jgi:RimJ/RimL family protein N-acetyltransferase
LKKEISTFITHKNVIPAHSLAATTMTVTLRPSTIQDAEAVAACIDSVARERKYVGNTQGFKVEETREFLTSLAQNGGIQIVAMDENTVVGWCDATPMTWEGMKHTCTLGMGLLKQYRGQGWGRKLIRQVLRHVFLSANNVITRVELQVFASNKAAIGLYESEGFKVEGRKRHARILDDTVDDVLVMGLLREEWLFLSNDS